MYTLVIVDDEPAIAEGICRLLDWKSLGFERIRTARSCFEVVSHVVDWKPDVCLVDVRIGNEFGYELINCLNGMGVKSNYIMMSGYDDFQYACEALRCGAVDYLLKPIGAEDVRNALKKLELFRTATGEPESGEDIQGLIRMLRRQESYKTHFLVPQKGDKLLPLSVESVYYFYINEGIVKAATMEGKEYPVSHTLDEIADSLNPIRFFRVNRQYLIARKAIKDIDLWFNGRLSVNLIVPVPEKILISRVRVAEFKEWFVHGE